MWVVHCCVYTLWPRPTNHFVELFEGVVLAVVQALFVAYQAPLSMGFSRGESWSGLPFPHSRISSWPRDQTHVPSISCIASRFFTPWAIGEAFPPWHPGDNNSKDLTVFCEDKGRARTPCFLWTLSSCGFLCLTLKIVVQRGKTPLGGGAELI